MAPSVDVDGAVPEPSNDPSFTWSVDYRFDGATATIVAVDDASGADLSSPSREPAREGQFDRAVRLLPDGRVTVNVLGADGTVWALTPSTGM